MNYLRLSNVAAKVALLLCCLSCHILQGYEGDVTQVTTIDTLNPSGPYDKIWEPHFAKWSDDHYITAYGLQVRNKVDMGDIVVSLSKDRG